MNKYGQIAILENNDKTYYYYFINSDQVIRVDDDMNAVSYPDWDIDVLTDDIMKGFEIEYLDESILSEYLNNDDFMDVFDEKYKTITEKLRGYKALF